MNAPALPRLGGMIGIRGRDQWLHCSFAADSPTAKVALEGDDVLLAPLPQALPPAAQGPQGGAPRRAGMACDRLGRLYRADPQGKAVLVQPLSRRDVTRLAPFVPGEALPDADNGPAHPMALAVTGDDHLIVLGEDEARVHVYDLLAGRYLGAHDLPRPGLDLAWADGRVFVLLSAPSKWLSFSLCEAPREMSWPLGLVDASRLAFSRQGRAFVLCAAGTAQARLVELGRPRRGIAVLGQVAMPGARDIALLDRADGLEVVAAGLPGQPLKRFLLGEGGTLELSALDGRTYDGRGLLPLPEGRVLFFGQTGTRGLGPQRAAPMRRRFEREGEVLLYRLDSGRPGNRWGRLFLDACLPDGCAILPSAYTSEQDEENPPAERVFPANVAGSATLSAAAMTILPSQHLIARDEDWVAAGLVRRGAGRGAFAILEAPILARPGRFLWLRIVLQGPGSTTPRLRRVLAERAGHDWLAHLPRAFARRDGESETFLQALLTPVAGLLAEADGQAAARHRLFNPATAPAEALPWLGEMLGLPVEPEWPEPVARAMLSEARSLLRKRGTVAGLRRMLEILTASPVSIVESFRLRAGGGLAAPGGAGGTARSSVAVLGAGFRIGGGLTQGQSGAAETEAAGAEAPDTGVAGEAGKSAEATIARHAHRFTVLVHRPLTPEVEQAARRLLDRHRPAHTLYTLCTSQAGLRAGVGGLVGITSLIGPTSGFTPAVAGEMVLGRGSLLARGGLAGGVFEGEGT